MSCAYTGTAYTPGVRGLTVLQISTYIMVTMVVAEAPLQAGVFFSEHSC